MVAAVTDIADPVYSLDELYARLQHLLVEIERAEHSEHARLERIRPEHVESARNLIHYIAVRRQELRPLQRSLSAYGLSTLGKIESMVRSWLLTVIATVDALRSDAPRRSIWGPLETGSALLARNTKELLGTVHGTDRATRIMVTMPTQAATDPELVAAIAAAGMDIARVNCAHDDENTWAAMIGHVRQQPGQLRVAMDLAGPKLRTGPLLDGPSVVKVKPHRDSRGVVMEPARIAFVAPGATAADSDDLDSATNVHTIPVDAADVAAITPGERLTLCDTRNRDRVFTVTAASNGTITAESDRTTYFETGQHLLHNGQVVGTIGALPPLRPYLDITIGDKVHLLRDMQPQPATRTSPHRIGCSLEAPFSDALPGQPIRFDDGKIGGVIRDVTAAEIVVEITHAGVESAKLRPEKGINFPDTDLHIPALTDDDRAHLAFVAEHADLVNYSFVRTADDVADLIGELAARNAHHVGIVLKIETRRAFENLPLMLLEAMRWPHVGVMIARGDLAVEVGFERLAEVQEEILWICEAAHVPVIWATEVLNTLAKTGLASRAEVTDAAMGHRAEAVMLNKGPYIVDAVAALESILERMGGHVRKRRNLMRPLASFSLGER